MDHMMMTHERVSACGRDLAPCHVDISGEYTDGDNPLGLTALVDLADLAQVPGCRAMPAFFFPRASAEKIVEMSNDPMTGDDGLTWDGELVISEYNDAIEPIFVDGIPYWRLGEDYLWEPTEGPEYLFELLPDGRGGSDLEMLSVAARPPVAQPGACQPDPSRDIAL